MCGWVWVGACVRVGERGVCKRATHSSTPTSSARVRPGSGRDGRPGVADCTQGAREQPRDYPPWRQRQTGHGLTTRAALCCAQVMDVTVESSDYTHLLEVQDRDFKLLLFHNTAESLLKLCMAPPVCQQHTSPTLTRVCILPSLRSAQSRAALSFRREAGCGAVTPRGAVRVGGQRPHRVSPHGRHAREPRRPPRPRARRRQDGGGGDAAGDAAPCAVARGVHRGAHAPAHTARRAAGSACPGAHPPLPPRQHAAPRAARAHPPAGGGRRRGRSRSQVRLSGPPARRWPPPHSGR